MFESDSEEMFEHPEALKLALISQFYQNASNYDLRRILKLIIQMEHDLEVERTDSIQQIKLPTPSKKFTVLILGEQTRLAYKIIPQQSDGNLQTTCPFVQYEQGTPLKPSSLVYYKTFISTSGDKLEACIKIIECPPNTVQAVTRDPTILREVLSYGEQADIILVSVAQDEKEDFENTRLSKILSNFEASKLHYIDWQSPDPKTNTISIDQLTLALSNAIDSKITIEREKICLMCSSVNDQIVRLQQANVERQDFNKKNQGNLKFMSFCLLQIFTVFMILLSRELMIYFSFSWQPSFNENSIIAAVWNQQVRFYQLLDDLIVKSEAFIGLASEYLTLIMSIVVIVFWFAKRQHSISLTVLTNAQIRQLTDFKNYLDRELVLNQSY